MVLMTPDSQTQIPLDELNVLIAKQKNVSLDELAVTDGNPTPKNTKKVEIEVPKEKEETASSTQSFELTPAEMRSRADTLYKEASRLRKEADAMDPPKSKKKTPKVEVE